MPKYCYHILEGKVKEIVKEKIRQVYGWYEVDGEELNIHSDHAYADKCTTKTLDLKK